MDCRLLLLLLNLALFQTVSAAEKIVNLTVSYKTVNFTGQPRKAIAVNDQIPAPTLHFKQGDHVTIHVHNRLDKETAIHWHGVLVPWQMDGVKGITQQGVKPGETFQYQFTLYQSGTYWYHAHAGLQEQQGLYGAFVIDPLKSSKYNYTKDYVIVLSDWSNTDPDQILANLKKSGDYYSPNFPLQPSLMKFIHDYQNASISERQLLLSDYKMMQQMRMSIYDLSDVAYDTFLLNGRPKSQPWTGHVKVGDVVRLRFIGAGGSSIFHVKIPDTNMQMVHIEGNDVVPYTISDFTIAPGETYDVLVKIAKNKPYIIYAESSDTVGAAYGSLITTPNQRVNYNNIAPFSEPLPVTREMMSMMMSDSIHNASQIKHMKPNAQHMNMNHTMHTGMQMDMPTESTRMQDEMMPSISSSYTTSLGTKYQDVRAALKTNDPSKPVAKIINMELFGYMDRFIWFINGLPEYKAHSIVLDPGKRYRFVFTNNSMMHHPMHIHGHWFILRNGHGAFDPLLHTIDVPPGATITADVDTDASGQWLFHCHFLYHMMAGMSRTFQYSSLIEITRQEKKPESEIRQTAFYNRPIIRVDEITPIDPVLVHHPMAHTLGIWSATYLEMGQDVAHSSQRLTYKGMYGYDYDKLELFMNDAEMKNGIIENADMDIFYWRLLNQFWAIKGGINYYYRPSHHPYLQPGVSIEGLMPYYMDIDLRGYYYQGISKLDIELSRDTQITNNILIKLGVRSIVASKANARAEIGDGLNQMRFIIKPYYRIMPGLNVFLEYEYEKDFGSFKEFQREAGEASIRNSLTVGVSALF